MVEYSKWTPFRHLPLFEIKDCEKDGEIRDGEMKDGEVKYGKDGKTEKRESGQLGLRIGPWRPYGQDSLSNL